MSRFSDVVIAGVLLVITLPLMLFVALAIHCETPGPFFAGIVASDAKVAGSRSYYFASVRMIPDIALASPARRLTRVGRFLRDTHIDALPQLLNILRGEMSLINRNGRAPSFLY